MEENDQALLDQVNNEVEDMETWAQAPRNNAKIAIKSYMAFTNAPLNGRSRFFVPKLHAVTYARMAMEAANMPKVEYKARKSASQPKMKFINAAKDNAETGDGNLRPDSINLWFHQNFDKILFGVGFRYLSYLMQTRIVKVKDDIMSAKRYAYMMLRHAMYNKPIVRASVRPKPIGVMGVKHA